MSEPSLKILVTDASVLINFLRVDRMDLFDAYPADILITDHVASEVAEFYPDQRERFEAALAAKILIQESLDDGYEVDLFAKMTASGRLGAGECSAIALAASRICALAIDDRRAISEIRRVHKEIVVFRTQDLVVAMIRLKLLSVTVADSLKADWEQNHRFKIKAETFGDLL